MTLGQLRGELEVRLGLKPGSLEPHRQRIALLARSWVLRQLPEAAGLGTCGAWAVAPREGKRARVEACEDSGSSSAESSEGPAPKRGRPQMAR